MECAAWSKRPPGAAYPVTRKIYNGTLAEAEADFAPDIIHFHWLTMAESHIGEVKSLVTVRGHSFDFQAKRIQSLINNEKIKALFLFPHQVVAKSAKIIPLNVGFDSTRYFLTPNKDRRQIVRCCAARPMKGLLDYIKIAAMCPDFTFNLCVAQVYGDNKFIPMIQEKAKDTPNVLVRPNVQPDDMAALMRSAGISLHTIDLPQSVGMCISVAEGMACGNYSIVKDVTPLKEMISGVGHDYKTNEQAAKLINDTKSWGDAKWNEVNKATERKASEFADFNVFPTLINYWKLICE
jgi:glycosyltransferase involved in cell wall biosynthesis